MTSKIMILLVLVSISSAIAFPHPAAAEEPQYYVQLVPINDEMHRQKRNTASVELEALNRKRYGTDMSVNGKGQLWQSQDKRSSLDANAYWQRHYGGSSGTGRPNYGGGLTFTRRF